MYNFVIGYYIIKKSSEYYHENLSFRRNACLRTHVPTAEKTALFQGGFYLFSLVQPNP